MDLGVEGYCLFAFAWGPHQKGDPEYLSKMAEAAGMLCFVNSMIEMGISVAASLHLAAGLPNLVSHGHALMSNLRIKEDILTENSFQYDGKDILVPQNCRGLGITIDEEKLERRTVDRLTLEL